MSDVELNRSASMGALVHSQDGACALTPSLRQGLVRLEPALANAWRLGDNIVIAWTRAREHIRFVAVRHYMIIEAFGNDDQAQTGTSSAGAAINEILAGPKFVNQDDFDRICRIFGSAAQVVETMWDSHDDSASLHAISTLVARYGVTLVRGSAAMLVDIVGFSLRTPLEQVAMLNSLSYSINSAYCQLLAKDIYVNFSRSTTGDGFYIWNRNTHGDANIALYKLLMLTLADNAIARRKARRFPVPELRTAFHIGEYYEFNSAEALNPASFGYIVGQATIDLSRMIERALPGQIIMGDFTFGRNDDRPGKQSAYGTPDFVESTAVTLCELNGMTVSDDNIKAIRCYLTGQRTREGHFTTAPYSIRDKHGVIRRVYNAKINIHLNMRETIFLGIQHKDLLSSMEMAPLCVGPDEAGDGPIATHPASFATA